MGILKKGSLIFGSPWDFLRTIPTKPLAGDPKKAVQMPGLPKAPLVENRRALFEALELVECTQMVIFIVRVIREFYKASCSKYRPL